MTEEHRLKTPSMALVQHYTFAFDSELSYSAPDQALEALFKIYPLNSNLEEVLIKVSALNSLYSTNIFAIVDAAKHIQSTGVDGAISAGFPTAIELVASMEIGGKQRRNYSFATKYCSRHNPNSYPVYDSYVDSLLWAHRRQDEFSDFKRDDLRNYEKFKTIVQTFTRHYDLEGCSFKELDKFLWLYGRSEFAAT